MIVGVASCPQPPLLLPGLTGAPVPEVERLRGACTAAVRDLLGGRPAEVVIVGGDAEGWYDGGEPLSIVLGRQLLAAAGCTVPVRARVVAAGSPTPDCLAAGRALAAGLARPAAL
ncbi:MAG TPA: hypothetical protein VMB79_15535, partial [Jatrophihabitans sp.]|nr:hypothetical protein [Jatrophihabitans sp.]